MHQRGLRRHAVFVCPSDSKDFTRYCPPPSLNGIFVHRVIPSEIMKIITAVRNNTYPGVDNIGPKIMLKKIAAPLAYIFNLSFASGTRIFSNSLKIVKVIPIKR